MDKLYSMTVIGTLKCDLA